MKLLSDNSGQVMLATAFMIAIILTFIALMLNNVIYFNNISYTGLMDQGHDDTSIKNIVTQEAISAYREAGGHSDIFNKRMQDLANSTNNVSLPEGNYIVISPPTYFAAYSPTPTLPYHSTTFDLMIYSKGSSKTYSIITYDYPPVATPIPSSTGLHCKVEISSPKNNSIVFQGPDNNYTTVMITVTNLTTGLPEGNQRVDLVYSTSIGWLYYDEHRISAVDSSLGVMTESSGTRQLFWFPVNALGAEGTDVIYAKVGINPTIAAQNRSNNVMLTNKVFTPCNHTVTIGTPVKDIHGSKKDKIGGIWYYYVTINIPVTMLAGASNFSSFSVGTFLDTAGSSNVYIGGSGNFTEPGNVYSPYNEYITAKLYLIDVTLPFTARLTTVVDGYCNVDSTQYSTTVTESISGTWS